MKIRQLKKLTSRQLLELESHEQANFEDGGLNRWTMPVIARYGYLFALSKHAGTLSGDIIGLSSFICKDKSAFLIGFWIKDSHRRQGLGRKLLTGCLPLLRKEGLQKIQLTVSEENHAANSLYEKVGFKLTGKLDDFYGPGQGRLLLSLNLVE